MKDLEKKYTKEDLNKGLYTEFRRIEQILMNAYLKYFSPKEIALINEAKDVARVPYYYAANKDFYIAGNETEAELKQVEIDDKINLANTLIKKFVDDLPENMRFTYFSIQEMYKERVSSYKR